MKARKKKAALKDRTFSPVACVLSPNDDRQEKEEARAARMAAQRRTSFAGVDLEHGTQGRKISFVEEDILDKGHILELLQNCIKLATENKINQRNTWDLRLIDHLSEVVTADDDQTDIETNFQKASCTLEASVKIYSYRVDSVHTDTFKVLGGVTRTAADEEFAKDAGSHGDEQDQEDACLGIDRKITVSATLESSYDSINAKKFNVAFTVDPLFQQTSAQFDEGGAKAFLLNTLNVYNGCTVAFDSSNVPNKSLRTTAKAAEQVCTADLSYIRSDVEQLMMAMKSETDISPTLRNIISMLEDPYRAAVEAEFTTRDADPNASDYMNADNVAEVGEMFDSTTSDNFEDSFESYAGTSPSSVTRVSSGRSQGDEDRMRSDRNIDMEDSLEISEVQTVDWIAAGIGLPSKSNSWAGPEHWKYRKGEQKSPRLTETTGKRIKKSKKELFSLDFLNPPQIDMSNFAPIPNKKSLILSRYASAVPTLLPQDWHYQADNLLRLYLHPSIMIIKGRRRRKQIEHLKDRSKSLDDTSSELQWHEDGDVIDNFGNSDWVKENSASEGVHLLNDSLLPHPRKVQRIEVKHGKMSKQVDVRVLKETLWQSMQELNQVRAEQGVSFQGILSSLPMNLAATTFGEISVHLCFICLLHLANEHSLLLQDSPDLNEIQIQNIVSTALFQDKWTREL